MVKGIFNRAYLSNSIYFVYSDVIIICNRNNVTLLQFLCNNVTKKIIFLKKITNRIKEALEKSSLNQAEFARRLGKTSASISRWVNAQTSPQKKDIKNIAKVLHISERWLEFGIGEMRENEALDSVINNTNYSNNSTFQEQQQKIMTLQEQLIQTTEKLVSTKDDLLNFNEKLLICNNEKSIITQKYNSLKESVLSKNIFNMINDSKFYEQAKKALNNTPKANDTMLSLVFIYSFL